MGTCTSVAALLVCAFCGCSEGSAGSESLKGTEMRDDGVCRSFAQLPAELPHAGPTCCVHAANVPAAAATKLLGAATAAPPSGLACPADCCLCMHHFAA